jgi:hypothetical protein
MIHFLPLVLVASNAAVWIGIVRASDRLPASYFEARDDRVQRTRHGVSISFRDHDPPLILAERAVLAAFGSRRSPVVWAAVLLNLPAVLGATVPVMFVAEPALGGMGWRAASWIQTAAFAALSSAQWWVIGSGVVSFQRWRRRRQQELSDRAAPK